MDILFVACMLASVLLGSFIHALGIKQGKAFAENKEVKLAPTPVKTFKEYKEKKEIDKQNDIKATAQENLMAYTGFAQKVGE